MSFDTEKDIPVIFLVGPPGAGKSSLGEKACHELGLRFIDLSTPTINKLLFQSQKDLLTKEISKQDADIIALPWLLQQDKGIRALLRRSGVILLLWAHPTDMQARSGHSESLFTPAPRIKTRGGFGRNGTGCREFRKLDRTADEVLILVDTPFDEAIVDLRDYIADIRNESIKSPIVRAGLSHWVEDWHQSYNISKKIITVIVDAMARYLLYIRLDGKSPRTLSGVYSDLQAAGMLVMMYDYPKRKKAIDVLELFYDPPWTIEFKRKFSDSPNAVTRYKSNLKGFARFLKETYKTM